MHQQFLHEDKAIHEPALPTLSESNITETDGEPGVSGPQLGNRYFCSVNSYYGVGGEIITCLKNETRVLWEE